MEGPELTARDRRLLVAMIDGLRKGVTPEQHRDDIASIRGALDGIHRECGAELPPGSVRRAALPGRFTYGPPTLIPRRMIAITRTDVDLFTLDELRAGLALILTQECAADVVNRISAIPEAEQAFYRWGYELVLAVSETSPDVADRVREHYGSTPEERERIAAEQRTFHGWVVATASDPFRVTLRFADLVIDTREPHVSAQAMIYSAPSAPGELTTSRTA
jgi:hypothetical protein